MPDRCRAEGCAWETGPGTSSGGPGPACPGGRGGPRLCAIDWLSTDPEDLEPYADWCAEQELTRPEPAPAFVPPPRGPKPQRPGY